MFKKNSIHTNTICKDFRQFFLLLRNVFASTFIVFFFINDNNSHDFYVSRSKKDIPVSDTNIAGIDIDEGLD